jgi:molybdate transport system substrate-binding protein
MVLLQGIYTMRVQRGVVVWFLFFGLFSGLLSGCMAQVARTGTPAALPATEEAVGGELIVFAAASLTDAFTQIATEFQARYPQTTIRYNFAGSQQLAQQLGQGAPADLFASANARQMGAAMDAGRILSGTQETFAGNRLVVITPADNPAQIRTLQDLARPGIKLVLASPDVPVGDYSLDFLEKASATLEYGAAYSQTVIANVVSYEESVRSVLSKVALGEADAGIVYTSDVALNASQVTRLEISDALNTLVAYPIAPVVDAENPALAATFVEYLLGPEGQRVLAAYGFMRAPE